MYKNACVSVLQNPNAADTFRSHFNKRIFVARRRPSLLFQVLGGRAVMFSLAPHATGAFTEKAPSRPQASVATAETLKGIGLCFNLRYAISQDRHSAKQPKF